ncbi:MAG TPA: hypothetical protein VF170_17015, partial [Planctomycetaceae bacterium]
MSTERPESAPAEPWIEPAAAPPAGRRPWLLRSLLWVLAFVLAASAMVYQRATGPTYPLKRTFTL